MHSIPKQCLWRSLYLALGLAVASTNAVCAKHNSSTKDVGEDSHADGPFYINGALYHSQEKCRKAINNPNRCAQAAEKN